MYSEIPRFDDPQPTVLEMMLHPADNLSATLMRGVLLYWAEQAIGNAIYNHFYERNVNLHRRRYGDCEHRTR